jgi:hypothetical protein
VLVPRGHQQELAHRGRRLLQSVIAEVVRQAKSRALAAAVRRPEIRQMQGRRASRRCCACAHATATQSAVNAHEWLAREAIARMRLTGDRSPDGREPAPGFQMGRTTEQRGPRDLVAGSVREQSRVERAACSTWLLLSARSRPVPVLARRCKSRPHGAQSPGVSTPNPGSERSRSSAGTEARTQAGTVSRSV